VAPAPKPAFGAPNDVTLKPLTTAPSKKAVPDDATPEELLAAINDSLTALRQFNAKFSQVSGNGQQTSGHLTVLHPGRLRFDYDAPATITIIADGSNVAIIDTRLKTQDVYSIGLTPLKFLLGSTIDLSRDLKILDIRVEGDRVIVEANDNATFGGVSQITLAFDTKNLLLRQWSVTDPQGYEVKVNLSAIDTKREVDPSLFVIPPRFPDQRNN
jgi:outer membrane lipoprotein-sorting protein